MLEKGSVLSVKMANFLLIEFRWDIVDIEGQACQVRMSTRTIWSVSFHMFMSLVNSLATKGAEKYADNMIKGEKLSSNMLVILTP